MNSVLTYAFLLSRWERVVWSALEITSSVDLLGRYANLSGSRVSGMMVLNCTELWAYEYTPRLFVSFCCHNAVGDMG